MKEHRSKPGRGDGEASVGAGVQIRGNDKRILIFSNRKNAYILSKEQLGDSYEPLKELAGSTLEKYRLKIK